MEIEKNQATGIRYNFPQECEDGINKQINNELYASYVYLSMSHYFERDDLSLPGFSNHFKQQSEEEKTHAEKLMSYQNLRGGRVILFDIKKPDKDDWGGGLEALKAALEVEKNNNKALLELRTIAEKQEDFQLCDFLDGEYLAHQSQEIKELADWISRLTLAGKGLGEYIFDKMEFSKTN